MLRTARLIIGFVVCVCSIAARGGELQVCTGSQPPFWFIQDGKAVGIEHDILQGFADRQGIHLKIKDVDFTKQIAMLQQGSCDIGAARMTITAERQKTIDFSIPYFSVRVAVVMRRGEVATDLKGLAGKKLMVNSATKLEDEVKNIPGITLLPMVFDRELTAMLQSREIDAFTSDSTMVEEFMKGNTNMELAFFLHQRDEYGFPMRKGDPLKKVLDSYITGIKQDGSYEKILNRYLDPETVALVLRPK